MVIGLFKNGVKSNAGLLFSEISKVEGGLFFLDMIILVKVTPSGRSCDSTSMSI